MTKLITSLIGFAITYLLLAAMVYGNYFSESGVLSVAVFIYWVLIIIAPVAMVLSLVGVFTIPKKPKAERYQAIVDALKAYKPYGAFKITYSVIVTLIITGLIAYSGYIFTAVVYAISVCFSTFLRAMIRDQLLAYERQLLGFNAVRDGQRPKVN